MHLGLRGDEARDMPWGEFLDLIAVEQIKIEGFKQKHQEDFWALLNYR